MIDHAYAIFLGGGIVGLVSPRLGMIYFIILGICGLAGVLH